MESEKTIMNKNKKHKICRIYTFENTNLKVETLLPLKVCVHNKKKTCYE